MQHRESLGGGAQPDVARSLSPGLQSQRSSSEGFSNPYSDLSYWEVQSYEASLIDFGTAPRESSEQETLLVFVQLLSLARR